MAGAGEDATLNLFINSENESYISYSREFYGAHIMLHHRESFGGKPLHRIISQTGFDTVIQIIPNVVVSAPDVRAMNLKQRGCFFDGEVGITLFK